MFTFSYIRSFGIIAAVIAGLFFVAIFNSVAVWAVTPSWTTNIDIGSDYTVPIVEYNSTRSEFALAYTTIDGSGFKFTTSSVGSSWAAINAISSHANGALTTIPLLTVNDSGSYYAAAFSTSAGIWATTANSGLTWTTSTPSGLEKYYNGAALATQGSAIYVGGSVTGSGISGYWLASSTNSGTSFASSSLAGSATQGQIAASASLVAGVYTVNADNTHLYVLTSSDGVSFETTTLTVSDSGGITNPRIAIDSNNRIWLAYYVKVGSTYYLEIATYKTGDAGSCIWATERIDTAGTVAPGTLDIAFLNGATPIITYNYKPVGQIDLRYAVRDNGNSGCSASGGTKWSCANIITNTSGNDNVSLASNGAGKVVVAYQNPTLNVATADFLGTSYDYSCSQSSSSNSFNLKSLLTPIFVGFDSVLINKGATHTQHHGR